MSQSSLILIVELSEMHNCDNGNTTFIRKELTHSSRCKIVYYCIFNNFLYILLISLCLINDEIYHTVLPPLVGGAIRYYIADSGVTYNIQKKHCCYILPGIFMKHMKTDIKISTAQLQNAAKSTALLRLNSIKNARAVSLYPCNRSQILQYVKYTK